MRNFSLALALAVSVLATSATAAPSRMPYCPQTELGRVMRALESWRGVGVYRPGDDLPIPDFQSAVSIVTEYYPRACGSIDSNRLLDALSSDACGPRFPAITPACIADNIDRSGARRLPLPKAPKGLDI